MNSISFRKRNRSYQMTEEINQLRANVQFCGAEKKVILFTSATEHEGKSSIALELSRSLAEIGKRTLLLDADMRKSVMLDKVKFDGCRPGQVIGLSHILAEQGHVEEALYQTDIYNLFVIFSGRVPPNASDLLSGERMAKLVNWARRQFDYVIIDCPPLQAVIDAAVIAPICDGAIIVIKADSVPYKMAQGVVKQLRATQCPILGVVLNGVEASKGGYYYRKYYKRYGYKKYGYGYGYGHYGSADGHADDDDDAVPAGKRQKKHHRRAHVEIDPDDS